MKHLLLVGMFFTSFQASAVPVKWTLQDFLFSDGRTATGSFIYDADTNTYSELYIDTTDEFLEFISPVELITEFDTSHVETLLFPGLYLNHRSPDKRSVLSLRFVGSLTNAGGTVEIDHNSNDVYENLSISAPIAIARHNQILFGSLSGVVVPLPASVWLFGSALMGLGWLRRKWSMDDSKAAPN